MGVLDRIQAWQLRGSSIGKAGYNPTSGPTTRSLTNEAQMLAFNRDFAGPNVQLGPGIPPVPTPLDTSGQPRQTAYMPSQNLPSVPSSQKQVSFETLRQLVRTYDLLGKAIKIRCDELCSLRFDIIARDTDRKKARQITTAQQSTIAELRAFFGKPDGTHTWQTWLRRLLVDHFTLDAVAVYRWRNFGGKLIGLRLLDGATIKVLLSIQGDTPLPPDPAYQQYLYGMARDSFTTQELLYAVQNPQLDLAYGIGAVEQFVWHVNEALRYGRARMDYFTDGTLPEGVAVAPPTTSEEQLTQLRVWWDGVMAGDTRQLHKLQWVPNGTTFHAFKTFEFNEAYAQWLVTLTALAMDVTPQQLGFSPRGQGLGGKGYSEEQTAIQKRKAVGPLTRWLCDEILNPIIWQDFGATDLQAAFIDEGDEEDQLAQAQAREIEIRSGQKSIAQIVEEDGGIPPNIGRIFTVGNNILFEPDLELGTKEGAHAIAGVVLDTPGETEKPPGAPKPGTPGSNDVTGTSTFPALGQPAQPGTPPAKPGAQPAPTAQQKAAEVATFLTFVGKRRKAGTWRDFASTVFEPETVKALNGAAKAGASVEELRTLIGLDDQPAAFRRHAKALGESNLTFNERLARRVAETIQRSA